MCVCTCKYYFIQGRKLDKRIYEKSWGGGGCGRGGCPYSKGVAGVLLAGIGGICPLKNFAPPPNLKSQVLKYVAPHIQRQVF